MLFTGTVTLLTDCMWLAHHWHFLRFSGKTDVLLGWHIGTVYFECQVIPRVAMCWYLESYGLLSAKSLRLPLPKTNSKFTPENCWQRKILSFAYKGIRPIFRAIRGICCSISGRHTYQMVISWPQNNRCFSPSLGFFLSTWGGTLHQCTVSKPHVDGTTPCPPSLEGPERLRKKKHYSQWRSTVYLHACYLSSKTVYTLISPA